MSKPLFEYFPFGYIYKSNSKKIMWWKSNRQASELAIVIRNLIQFKEQLLRYNDWLPFPTSECNYRFGEKGEHLPIGAMFHLWGYWEQMTGICNLCGGFSIYGYGFRSYMSHQSIVGVCKNCEQVFLNDVGSVFIDKSIREFLKETPYFVKSYRVTYDIPPSQRSALIYALKKVGATELPDEAWCEGEDF